jgi:hypothetical protein
MLPEAWDSLVDVNFSVDLGDQVQQFDVGSECEFLPIIISENGGIHDLRSMEFHDGPELQAPRIYEHSFQIFQKLVLFQKVK